MFALSSCLLAQIDFNLYGMGQLRLGNALFRHPLPEGPHLRQGWADSPNLHLSEGAPCMPCQRAYINGCAPVLQNLNRLWEWQGFKDNHEPIHPEKPILFRHADTLFHALPRFPHPASTSCLSCHMMATVHCT